MKFIAIYITDKICNDSKIESIFWYRLVIHIYDGNYLFVILFTILYYWDGLQRLNLVTGSMSAFSSLSCLSRDHRNRLCTLGASLRRSTSLRYQLSHSLGLTLTPRACFILIMSLRRTNW